ncbi:MAG: hypothetical protein DCC71_12100 [Proteobacteria bacterium]|nr:MAG: hypothetical protein DCC71_12100 [Pseudomonadota bacterium]
MEPAPRTAPRDEPSRGPLPTSLPSAGALALIAALLGLALLPCFTESLSALTGDNVTFSLPMHASLHRALHDGSFRFWDPAVSFGFPLYAEGQLAWFHPWKLALLGALPLLAAHDAIYLSSFVLTAACSFAIARTFGLGVGLALVAGLALAFSPAVIGNLYNASYAHSIAWSALCLLAFERWYAQPTRARFAGFAAATSLALFAGYVPTVYALFLFLGIAFAIRLAWEPRRIVRLAPAFAAALALGVGIAAVQVLPLLELAAHSVRQDSVEVLNAFPWQNFLAGLAFDPAPARYAADRYVYFAAPLATVLAAIAFPCLPLLRDRRALSYAGAIAACVLLGAGPGGWGFELARAALPGFDRLRLLSPFLFVVLVPSGVLLAALLREATRTGRTRAQLAACGAVALFLALIWSGPLWTALPSHRAWVLGLLAATLAALAALRASGRLAWAPALFAAVVLAEIAALRPAHFSWMPDSVLDEGAELGALLREKMRDDPDARAMHFPSRAYDAAFKGMVLQHWTSPGYAAFVRSSMAARTPFANLLDDLPFAEANGALPLAGFPELLATMQDEVRGRVATPPGEREIDRFRVRWVVQLGDVARLPVAPALRVIWSAPSGRLALLENDAARPLLQWRAAPPLAAASEPALVRIARALPWVAGEAHGEREVDAPADGRLFVPIPHYAGWIARVDGTEVVPRPADGFGMELPVAAGRRRVELRFVPAAFHVGVCVSLASALAVAGVLASGRRAA